jgi:hypothetical protein
MKSLLERRDAILRILIIRARVHQYADAPHAL